MATTNTHYTPSFEHFRVARAALLCDDLLPQPRLAYVAPARTITRDLIALLLNATAGLVTVVLSPERVQAFMLSAMRRPPTTQSIATPTISEIAFCTSVEARVGVTTGISADDRAVTIRALGETTPNPRDIVQPGHIFPIEAREGGVLVRTALQEGALDLMRILEESDAALSVELVGTDGEYQTLAQAQHLARAANVPIITLSELVAHRLSTEKLIHRVAEARVPTALAGEVTAIVYRTTIHGGEHIALVKGAITPEATTLTRVQLEFTFGDVFGGVTPPSKKQINSSLQAIGDAGRGVFLYLRRAQPGQLRDQIRSWEKKFREKPAVTMREYGIGAQILRDLGVRKMELLSEKKRSYSGLESFGLEIVGQRELQM